jgi:hypothetical protein
MASPARGDFLAALYAGCEGFRELRALPSRARAFVGLGDDAAATRFAAAHASENVYVAVATRKDATSGMLTNCRHLGALFVDIDFKSATEANARSRLARFALPPSAIVHSGGGIHVYWLLREPMALPGETLFAGALLRRLAHAFGGDRAAAEPARVLRLPGTLNQKYTPARTVTLEFLDAARRYNPSELDELLPEPATSAGGAPFTMPDEPLAEGEGRNNTIYRLVRALRAKQLSTPSIVAAAEAENARFRPPLPDAELSTLLDHALTQPNRPDFEVSYYEVPQAPAPTVRDGSPWERARPVADFVNTPEAPVEWLHKPLLAPGSLTQIFSPRGLGKTHVAYAILVELAGQGVRILLLDRDNSRREVSRRLRAWGAGNVPPTFKLMTRDDVPPLTDEIAWQTFPFGDYDVVVIDSLDASTEGVGEKDSSRPSKAISPLLDIAHRADGPSILVLGNTIKTGENSRGSGVVEDRADIVYEVRDATGLTPTGTKEWWLELPAPGRAAWGERAARRRRRDSYRLAFIPSKFRIGEEPEPFILEIDLSTEPWRIRDVTAEVVEAGTRNKEQADAAMQRRLAATAEALRQEIQSRTQAGQRCRIETTEVFLRERGLSRAAARSLILSRTDLWTVVAAGREKHLILVKNEAAAELASAESPINPRLPEEVDSAARMDTGRRDSEPPNSAPDPAIFEGAISPRLPVAQLERDVF